MRSEGKRTEGRETQYREVHSPICVPLTFVNVTQSRVTLDERTPAEGMLPSD